LTSNLDEALWDAELAVGEGLGSVYTVETIGEIGDVTDQESPGHPSMSFVRSLKA
jgi:rifampin ADP-ribosylating transferase